MERRIEHYIIRTARQKLEIIQDQRSEMKRGLVFVISMMVVTFLFGPWGAFPVEGFSATWFWGVELGWCVSAGVAFYATSYTKEHLFYKNSVEVIEKRGGRIIHSSSFSHDGRLRIKVEHQHYSQGPRIGNTPVRLGGSGRLKIFPYTVFIYGPGKQKIKLSLSGRRGVDLLIQEMEKIYPEALITAT